jgi:hypothetical protein
MFGASCIDQELSGLIAQAARAAPRNLRRSTARLFTGSRNILFIIPPSLSNTRIVLFWFHVDKELGYLGQCSENFVFDRV